MEDYEKCYDEIWKSIIEKDGVFDVEQVKKELHDYHTIMQNVKEVYCEITNGATCNPFVLPTVILSLAEEGHRKDFELELESMIEDYDVDGKVSVEDIRSYFSMEDKKN